MKEGQWEEKDRVSSWIYRMLQSPFFVASHFPIKLPKVAPVEARFQVPFFEPYTGYGLSRIFLGSVDAVVAYHFGTEETPKRFTIAAIARPSAYIFGEAIAHINALRERADAPLVDAWVLCAPVFLSDALVRESAITPIRYEPRLEP
jgi:hypothetical protein